MPIFNDNSETIGRSPLVRINRLTKGLKATVLAKIEGRNPAYSVKCRIGAAMVWDAEQRGLLGPRKELVDREHRPVDVSMKIAEVGKSSWDRGHRQVGGVDVSDLLPRDRCRHPSVG